MINNQSVFLVVDDFEAMIKVIVGQLHSMGVRTILTARNGAEALLLLRKQRVDMVLSDWNMPVMTGLELLKEVRGDTRLANVPFIMITADAERHHVEEAIAYGVSDLLVKPYTPVHFAEAIEKALTSPPRPILATRTASAALVEAETKIGASSASIPTIAHGDQEQGRPTILVVDDMPDNLEVLSQLFTDKYRVLVARSGETALTICQSNTSPDLVLLDIMMPDMDGFETARRMREHPMSEAIPVIFVTAITGDEARLKGLELGAVDFVTKPIDPDVLKLRVHNFLRYVGLRKQLQANYDSMLKLARLSDDVEHITRHDIKGLLAGVIGLVQAVEEDRATNTKQYEQLRIAEETALQVLNMINLSSELFKIETGRFTLDAQPVKISDVLRRIAEMSRTAFSAKHLIIQISTNVPVGEELPLAQGDAMFCYSLFQNLVKNACEAAPEKTKVTITLYDEAPLRITIQNKGAVPVEIRDRFFDKFVTYGKEGGTGLGTYSAKLLAEAQNGGISLEVSDEEKETMVTVTLPRSSVRAESKTFHAI